jgi:hypothetical protein
MGGRLRLSKFDALARDAALLCLDEHQSDTNHSLRQFVLIWQEQVGPAGISRDLEGWDRIKCGSYGASKGVLRMSGGQFSTPVGHGCARGRTNADAATVVPIGPATKGDNPRQRPHRIPG